jgi:hypothetical protein
VPCRRRAFENNASSLKMLPPQSKDSRSPIIATG